MCNHKKRKTMNYFEVKVKRMKADAQGVFKEVNELYLADAVSVADAQYKVEQMILAYDSVALMSVTVAREVKYKELFLAGDMDDDRYFKAAVGIITLDEKTGREKKARQNMLVRAGNLCEACARLEAGMKDSMMDYDVVSIADAKYVEIVGQDAKPE